MLLEPLMSQYTLPSTPSGDSADAAGAGGRAKGSRKRQRTKAKAVSTLVSSGSSPAAAPVPDEREGYDSFTATYVIATVGQLAVALGESTVWKQLNHGVR